MSRSSRRIFSLSWVSDSNSLRYCRWVSMYRMAASTAVRVPTSTTWLHDLSTFSRVTLVLSCSSLKCLPPLPMSHPTCSGLTSTRSVTYSSISRAASTDSCVGPMMTTRGPCGSTSTRSTPVAFCVSTMFLPPLPTTRPITSLVIGNSTRQPSDSFSFSLSSLVASCWRSLAMRCMSPWCLMCSSSSIFAVEIALSDPMSLSCDALPDCSNTRASSPLLVRTSSTMRSLLWNQARSLGSAIGITCFTYMFLLSVTLEQPRMLLMSTTSSGYEPP
mmetsp:Transcript_47006/g.130610  ORF Transcript_47006/g.130610 Transcript_47006/m.130610 type:complete len:274 (+) Transcript_47006:280-1101(+)